MTWLNGLPTLLAGLVLLALRFLTPSVHFYLDLSGRRLTLGWQLSWRRPRRRVQYGSSSKGKGGKGNGENT